VALSHAPSIVPLLGPSLPLPSLCNPSPLGLGEGRSGLDSDNNLVDSSHEVGSGNTSDREENVIDNFIEASGLEPKAKEDIWS